MLLSGKLPQWNLHVNCHINGTTFQGGLRFQNGLSSFRVSCKRALLKRCSENIQQIYRRTLMSKCDFNKVPLQSPFELALRHGCSPVNLLHISEHLFLRTPPGGLLLWILLTVNYYHLGGWSYFFQQLCLVHFFDTIFCKWIRSIMQKFRQQ